MRDNDEKIILTSDFTDREKLVNLSISALINNKAMEVSIDIVQNILTISTPALQNFLVNKGIPFEITINYNGTTMIVLDIFQE